MENTPAIIAIGYNRPDSMKRLLNSIEAAKYSRDDVTLIISIDKSDSDAVVNVANDFKWSHGEKIVIAREENMGLKAHVLACSSLSKEYGSAIILEDDLFVSPMFYEYSIKALDFAKEDESIGGISLYNHLFNVHARKSFAAIDDGYDNWYFQFASSWGQCYTASQWGKFEEWLSLNESYDFANASIPANVASWSEKSWLKYYIAYLVETNKYFLYPRIGYTTNFGDIGSHAKKADTDLQTPLAGWSDSLYLTFSSVSKSQAVYDAYFENVKLKSDTIIDLYGTKPINEMISGNEDIKYVLSSKSLPMKIIDSFARQMRPIDANVKYSISGDELRLYDVKTSADAPKKNDEGEEYLYEYRGISAKQMGKIIKYRMSERL